jgi:LysM repeat protein
MGYWGWRPLALAIFVCVWVAGCNLANEALPTSASPSPYPVVTLTVGRPSPPQPTTTTIVIPSASVETPASAPTADAPTPTPLLYIVQDGDTLLDIALRHGVSLDGLRASNANVDLTLLQIGQPLVIPSEQDGAFASIQATPTSLPLSVQPPTCYDTRAGTTVCLGRVANSQDTAAGQVTLEVRLLRSGGEPPLVEIATVEQSLILPGALAPYRVVFNTPWSEFTGATAVLRSADATFDSSIVTLAVENQRVELVGGSFEVRADLVNAGTGIAQPLRAIVTLQNEAGEVIGYRVAAFDSVALPPGGHLPLLVELVPQVYPSTPLHVSVYAEARAL